MATGTTIITAAFNKVSVYSPTAAQSATALLSLNSFIATLAAEELHYAVTGETKTLTAGTDTYTWGSTGDIATTRPQRLDNCFLRDSDGYDYPVEVVAAKDYNDIIYKSLSARPERVYFLPEYPLAKILFECDPDAAYTAYLDSVKPLTGFATAATTMDLPPEYEELLIYNLAVICGEDWDRKVSPTVILRAKELRDIVSSVSASNRVPRLARFDFSGGGRYNITIDR